MVTSFAVSPVEPAPYNHRQWDGHAPNAATNLVSSRKEFKQEGCGEVLQESPLEHGGENTYATSNGFVLGVVRAYNEHHHLVLRPDDVWLAIMTQFGLYANANAEMLRHSLVKHDGKKELVVMDVGSLRTVDYGRLASRFIGEMEDHLVDPTLGEWVLPGFSTTTDHDRIVGSVVMMATMKKFFDFKMMLSCGIPTVTLLGTVEDWVAIRTRVDALLQYGPQMTEWVGLLSPILDQFVNAAKGTVDTIFWQRICNYIAGGSGPSYLSGWITAFSVFDADGKWQGSERIIRRSQMNLLRIDEKTGNYVGFPDEASEFPVIEIGDVSPGYLTVDVTIDDNGVEYKSLMFAGHMSYAVQRGDTIVPQLTWAIALKTGKPGKSEEEELIDALRKIAASIDPVLHVV
ncbi:Aste57867_21184 [Aphanomyces stellatus]|uniref:Aste57867_21184 protein n=1 Tax=Aphanomyces stellatus TaxID=120398 RepID=A0A485LHK3_9STRA|nr:hypothetical protein As57867_021116 [Aphanomyces stellatus]VFT97858.1 Aste57867_21184 [Aphanomyces stellatus]